MLKRMIRGHMEGTVMESDLNKAALDSSMENDKRLKTKAPYDGVRAYRPDQ